MAKKGYLGDARSKAQKITKYYFSDENGKAKRGIKVYLGDEEGVARLIHTEVGEPCIHSFLAETIEPNCTDEGFTLKSCTICGAQYKENVVAALGHTEGDPVEENRVEPNCTEDGRYDTAVYCSVCGVELSRETTVLDALGHTWVRGGDYAQLDDDQHSYPATCSVCGETTTVYEEHDWVADRCDRAHCSKCYRYKALDGRHSFDERWVNGFLCNVCTICGYTERV